LINPLIRKLRDPAHNLLADVYTQLENIGTDLVVKNFERFPAMSDDVSEIVSEVIRGEKEKTQDLIDKLLEAEITYIFTNDSHHLGADGSDELEELLDDASSEWGADSGRARRSADGGNGEDGGVGGSSGEAGVVNLGGESSSRGGGGGGDSHGGVSVPVLSDVGGTGSGVASQSPVVAVLVVNGGLAFVDGCGAVGSGSSSSTWWDGDLGLSAVGVVDDHIRGSSGSVGESESFDAEARGGGVSARTVVGGIGIDVASGGLSAGGGGELSGVLSWESGEGLSCNVADDGEEDQNLLGHGCV